jgi:hypothetical protein
MKRIVTIAVIVLAMGCSSKAAGSDAAAPSTCAKPEPCPACPACPPPPACPECTRPDAIDFAVIVRMVGDKPSIEMVQAYLHEAGAWKRVMFTVADDAQSVRQEGLQQAESTAPMDYPPGDKLIAIVRADPERHGTVSIPESAMQHWQYGRTIMGGVWDDFGRHKVYVFTGFRLLQ